MPRHLGASSDAQANESSSSSSDLLAQNLPDTPTPEELDTIVSDGSVPVVRHTSRSGVAVYGIGTKKPESKHHRPRKTSSSSSRRSSHHHHHHHHRHHRRINWKPLLIVLLVIALPVVAALAWVGHLNKSMSMGDEGNALTEELATQEQEAEQQGSGYYVLLVGSDAREGETTGRGDVIMLTHVDPDNGKVALVSIPRDTMIKFAGVDDIVKMNSAYAYGGAARQVHEVSRFAGVPIRHYAEVDFEGLERLVDRLGGVWVNVPETVGTGENTIEAGPQTLTGKQALAYARHRYTATGGDFGRAQAQRLIVQAIIRQVLAANPLELASLIGDLAACVSTDYTVPDLVNLALQFRGGNMTIYSTICPSYALWEGDVAYVATMLDEWRDMMKRVDAGLDPDDTSVAIPEPQASNEKLGSASNSASPTDYKDKAAENMTTDVVPEPGSQDPAAVAG